jgi:hypothetical protein
MTVREWDDAPAAWARAWHRGRAIEQEDWPWMSEG